MIMLNLKLFYISPWISAALCEISLGGYFCETEILAQTPHVYMAQTLVIIHNRITYLTSVKEPNQIRFGLWSWVKSQINKLHK